MPLPDILQFIGLSRKTGILHVEQGPRSKHLVFEDGRPVFCSSGTPKEYLGQHLLSRTSLTEEALASAFERQAQSGKLLGEVLAESGSLSAGEIRTVLCGKVQDSLFDLFTWPSGKFAFEDRALEPADAPVRFPLEWQDAVMEGCRRADEMTRVRETIPGPAVRFHAVRTRFPEGFPKTSGDRKLVELVDSGLSAGEICPRFHASDFDILMRLAALVRDGILRVDEGSAAEARVPDGARQLRKAVTLIEEGSLGRALEALRDGARDFPDECGFTAQLGLLESRIRSDAERLGGLDAVPVLDADMDRLTRLELTSKQAFVVSRINGSWSVRLIAMVCPFDEVDVLATVEELARLRAVELKQPATASARK